MKRRKLISLTVGLAIAWPLASYAQEPKQPPKRVGVLVEAPCPPKLTTGWSDGPWFKRLSELGWIEGQTIVFDCVSTAGHQVPALASELVSRRPDVLTAGAWAFVRALKQETTTIPIVMLYTWEPVRLGLISSFARTGGNVTGVAWFNLTAKVMEILKETVPNLKRVAFIRGVVGLGDQHSEGFKIGDENRELAASALGFTWQIFDPATESDYDEIFARLAAEHFDAAYVPGSPINVQNRARICQLALRHRIPAISEEHEWAKRGLLLTYGQDFPWTMARAMDYVDKIMRGARPDDLPVEQAPKLVLTINLKTAKELGLTVPTSLIARADEVIE
jgi:putative ABC transport system substrate-binding protein